jgi:hypothetical protein
MRGMFETASGSRLEFATKEMPQELQKGIMQVLPSKNLLVAYHTGRNTHRTNDIVLAVSAEDPELITPFPRFEYLKLALKNDAARRMQIAHESAYQVAKLPIGSGSSAFWLAFEIKGYPAPIMCVLYEIFYEAGDHVEAPTLGGLH